MIFLVDGTPQGLRLVQRPSWTGSFLAFARADYAQARKRPEMNRTGAYVLVGPDPTEPLRRRVYIGEGDAIIIRVDAQQREKDFWTHAYVLTTKDDSLNKAHVRYIEAQLLALARAAGVASIDNGTEPDPASLSEPETAEMETYLDYALPLFPLVGVNVFESVEEQPPATSATPTDEGAAAAITTERLYLSTQLTQAEGEDQSRGFLVLEDSKGRLEKMVMQRGYEQLRDTLLHEGTLVEEGDHVRLVRSYLFDSPSAAASVMAGGNKNGRTEWRDAAGRTLKELEERATPATGITNRLEE
ncbi:MAG TPA: GIY-YIG nuclease family protein [Solirubrobacteraceae bacterium]